MNGGFQGILILLSAISVAGCVDGQPPGLPERVTIPPGEFYEINLNMGEEDSIAWAWNASGVLDFDVHTHSNGQVQVHDEESTTSAMGNYMAANSGVHSLMWVNNGDASVTLSFTLEGTYDVHSTYPA